MKKALGVLVLGIFLLAFGMNFVAATTGPVEAIQSVVGGAYELVKPVLEGITGEADTAEFFLAKIMFMIVIFAIIWKSLEKVSFFKEVSWVLWLVSIAVSILSIRWFGDASIVRSVLLPYSALGITLTAGIPFVIYFFMTVDFQKTMRKISWIFFIVVFFAIWITRAGKATVGGPVGGFAYIYLVTAGLGLAVLMFDGTIHKIRTSMNIEKRHASHKNKIVIALEKEAEDMHERFGKGADSYHPTYSKKTGHAAYEEDLREIRRRISHLNK